MIKDDYELKIRRNKVITYYQKHQAPVDCQEGKSNPSHISPLMGQIAGRSVVYTESGASKESRLFQSHMHSTNEDRLLQNYVNTVKKTEPHDSFSRFWSSSI